MLSAITNCGLGDDDARGCNALFEFRLFLNSVEGSASNGAPNFTVPTQTICAMAADDDTLLRDTFERGKPELGKIREHLRAFTHATQAEHLGAIHRLLDEANP